MSVDKQYEAVKQWIREYYYKDDRDWVIAVLKGQGWSTTENNPFCERLRIGDIEYDVRNDDHRYGLTVSSISTGYGTILDIMSMTREKLHASIAEFEHGVAIDRFNRLGPV